MIALWGSFRAIGPGGDVEKAFDQADLAMRPLGLRVIERPDVGLETRGPSMPGYSARLRGALVLEGERHGRRVNVRVADGASAVAVAARSPEFAGKARDGRVRLGEDGPAAVRDALETVPASQRWGGVELRGGPEGIVVDRKRSRGEDWLCDLWLAERVASGLMEEAGAGDEAFQR